MVDFERMWTFWLKCALVLICGILGTNSGGDPFPKQPRLTVQDGHLTIRSGYNRNVSISTNGDGGVLVNRVSLSNLARSSQDGRTLDSGSVSTLNRRMTQLLNQYQSLNDLVDKVNQLEENVTEISQRMGQFIGSDQNRITNRGMRRYFAKVKILEDKVNHLTELLSANECSSNPCRNGGTCVDAYNGFVCNCPTNWEGPTCESDVNECALYAGTGFGCQNGATCTNLPGSYRCDCATNWFGIHCTEQHDDCNAASHQELCGHGTCVNEKRVQPGQPKYRCICEPGWTTSGNSPACTQDVDECAGRDPKCSVNPRVYCFNLPGTFHCGPCPVGYTGNGLWCEDLNECETNNGGCSINPYVECYNTPGSRRCGPCPNGYFGNGEQCMYQSVCNNNRGGCHPLATCIDNPAITATYRECRCPSGYVGNGEGVSGCVPMQGITCDNNPCQHGTCQMIGNAYRCICNAGYYGTNCETAQDPCSTNPCLNGGTCIRGSGTFTCNCLSGYSGSTCADQRRTCGGYLTESNGTLHYPEFSPQYEHEENCAWVISVEPGKVVNITFDHFHLEPGYNCEYDFLQLNDGPNAGSRVIGRFCSDDLHGETFTSTHNEVYLWFRSDRTVSATGFTITWAAVDPVCGGIFDESEYGAVRSPGYPGLYPVNRTCSYLVQVPFGKRIQFSFATLMLETHENCSYDYIKIYDGATDRDPLIGTFCTTVTPPPLITSGHAATLVFHSDHSVQDSGFNIAYSSIPGVEGCGGTYTAPEGTVTNPSLPYSDDHQQCEWLVRIRPKNRLKISFLELDMAGDARCRFDYVEIFDGPSDGSRLIGKFCGNTLPPEIISNSHQVYIRFKKYMYSRGTGFKLEYKTICGGVYSDLNGTLTSPFYPESYQAHTFCIYEIIVPAGYLVNLTVTNLEIEFHSDCIYDYLEVRDGDDQGNQLALLCGYYAPESIVSTYNKLWLKFLTDGSVNNRGFSARYEAIEIGCGGIHTDLNGVIASPRNGDFYPHGKTCVWLIRGPESHIVRLTFSSFNLESSSSCSFDYVLVEDTDGIQIGKYCGNVLPPMITSIYNTMIVKFFSDDSVARDGFSATYQILDASEACGGDLYQTSGVIRSPGYPQHYPHSAHCVWTLHAPNGRQILLNATDFKIEAHDTCKYDYVEIRNGGYNTSPLIGKFCGTNIMPIIRSHSNALRLEFKTDRSMSEKGFALQFDSTVVGCGGTITGAQGSIVSPNYPQPYPLNADCEWLIKVSEGSVVSLTVVDVDIEEHQTCFYDYLQIFDGPTENSKSLLKICNNQQNPGTIESTGNSVLIRFRSDFSEEAGGFHLAYQALCNNVLRKRRGVIESPNFPNSYPHNHNCSWTIQAPPGSNISLAFSHLFIEGNANCSLDYVEIMEVPLSYREERSVVSLGRFCGDMTRPPNTITTTTNTAIVQLITDRSVSSEGFRLEWTFEGCGGDFFNKPWGYISSPNYPDTYPVKTVCYWHIWYPPGSSVQLTVEDLDLEGAQDCVFDFLRVYGGENEEAPRILNICHHQVNTTIVTSHGNEMYVHFQSDYTIAHRGFRASFRQMPTGCGGLFTADEATIMSPNFPDPYATEDACEWLIQVSSTNRVVLEFYEFEMPEATNCSHGHVAVYDGGNTSAPLLLRHCGGSKPEGLISATTNQMLVQLVSDGYNIAKGFKAHYKAGCGRRLLADNGGEIMSSGYPAVIHFDANCSWIIYASEIGEKVSLTVTHLYMPDYDNCSYYSLQIFDGDMEDSPMIGKYCGRHMPPPIVSRGSTLHVFLQNGGVFRAVYGLLSEHCGGTFTGASGSFASPGFPTNYDMEMECVWTIEASPGSNAHISFQSFHLESSDHCNTDYLEIRAGNSSGPLIGKYCGDAIPSNVSSAHKLWIKFRSDDIGTAPGFMAHYELEHGQTITGTSGEIASPGYPANYVHDDTYYWYIVAPDGMFISVYFQEIAIASYGDTPHCLGFVKIYDGFDETAPDFGEFCGYSVPEPVFSTGNTLTIQFSATMRRGSLFHLHWSAANETGAQVTPAEESCLEEHTMNSTDVIAITSPNYPEQYPNNYYCEYIIRTAPTHHVDLQFEEFQFEGSFPNCPFDKLESYYTTNPNVDYWILNSTLCGPMSSLHLTSPNNLLKLTMSTDSWLPYRGFKAIAKAECGGQLFGNTGVLRSSSIYPNIQNMSRYDTFQCSWLITVKDRRTLQLTFENFDIESDAVCSTNYLLLRNGGFPTSPVLGSGRYCGSSIPVIPESGSHQVYVQLVYKPTSGRSPLFDLHYSVTTVGCGGRIYLNDDTPYAEISSPNYPSPPTHDAECIWVIISPSGTRLRVDFESEFHMGPNCWWGENIEYLQINDGGTETAPGIRRFCGHDQPSSVSSTGNALFMKYVTDTDDRQPGFKATVRIAHCGGTISSWYSAIVSPDFPKNYGSSIECEWFLKMKFGYHITLTITEFETPSASNCSYTDFLEIRSMDAQGEILGTFCGNPRNLPIVIDVPGPEAYVKFKSNSAVTAKGFSMIMQSNYEEGCGGSLSDPSAVITSPRYPNALPHARQCFWRIAAPPGRSIKVTFEEMNLPLDENLNTCASFVTVFNVSLRYMSSRLNEDQHKYCGTSLPGDVDSSGNGLYISFSTHGLSAGQGFKLRYSTDGESICGGQLPSTGGVFASPNFTVQNDSYIDCVWSMDISENQTFAIKFEYLSLPGSVASFCQDSVLFVLADERFLGAYCGNTSEFIFTSPFPKTNIRLISTLGVPFRGFSGTYHVSNCGGVLNPSNSEITSPGYPNAYPANVDCEWYIDIPYYESIKITFLDLRLENDCSKDYVKIVNGRGPTSPVIGKFCGTNTVAPMSSVTGSVRIVFHSDEFGTAPGFKISTTEVQRGCGGLIHTLNGNITSPNYPARYNNNEECVWTVEYAPGYLVKVEFLGRFEIEMDNTCSKDYVQFDEAESGNTWTTRDKKCGPLAPAPFVSKSNKLRVIFHSNDRINGDGFDLRYTAVCGGNFTNPKGEILSPNYPGYYSNALDCTYVIGKSGDYVSLTFDSLFSIEGHSVCYYDYVEIYQREQNAENRQGQYCGTEPPAPRTLVGPVFVRFVTDYGFVAYGFKLEYEIMNCGATLTSPSGIISTPIAEGSYINQMDCTWHIVSEPNKVIQLRFLYFDVEPSYTCYYDYLEINDGNETSPSLGRFCGEGVPNVKSTGNELTLRFRSNYRVTSKGFKAYYSSSYGAAAGCGGTKNSSSGEITSLDMNSDGLYEPDLDCGWMILAPTTDQIIRINFNSFDLQMPFNGTCENDYLELREYSPSGNVIGRHCGNTLPAAISTNAEQLFVHFHTDSEDNKAGFRLTYTVTPSPCGPATLVSAPEAKTLTSPNYPNAYPENIRCQWMIVRSTRQYTYPREVFEVNVTDLDIPCGGDYLMLQRNIQDRYQTQIKSCGTTPPLSYKNTQSIMVVFNSDAVSNGGRGFSLTYKDAGCNNTYTSDSGMITSVSYPLRVNTQGVCHFNITASSGKTIAVYFRRFDVQPSESCTNSYMKVYDGDSASSSLVATYCGYSIPNPVFSTGASLHFEVKMANKVGWYQMSYLTTDKGRGCGGSILSNEGALSSPFYPQAYNKTGECAWTISVPGYHTVELQFQNFGLNSTEGCDTNYLEIYEGSTEDITKRIARYCGQDFPSDHQLRTNSALVKLVTDSTNNLSGFLLYFSASRYVAETSSQNFAQRFPDEQ